MKKKHGEREKGGGTLDISERNEAETETENE